jgi:LacI family transcriptional regulator
MGTNLVPATDALFVDEHNCAQRFAPEPVQIPSGPQDHPRKPLRNVYVCPVPTRRTRKASMSDVAKEAGVSVTTVSHVINRTRVVSEATERAVMAAVARCGYVPEHTARSLRHVGSHTIGVAMSAISNVYFGEVVQAIEGEAAAHGYTMLLADTHDRTTDEIRVVGNFLERGVEAVVLAPAGDGREAIAQAARAGVPLVLVDRLVPDAAVDQVGTENVGPMRELVSHLADTGHRRIGLVSGLPGLVTTEERIVGYREALRGKGIRASAELVRCGSSDVAGGRAALLELLDLPKPPTAVVVANNLMTIGALEGVRDRGLRIPEDLALVSFDDFPWADVFHPRLTAMAQPTELIGREAVRMVLARLADPELPPRRVVMPPTLKHRDSCGCTGAGSRRTARPARETVLHSRV